MWYNCRSLKGERRIVMVGVNARSQGKDEARSQKKKKTRNQLTKATPRYLRVGF